MRASLRALADVERDPGVAKPDPILTADNVMRTFGGLTAVDVEHLEVQRGVITALIGPERRREDDPVQPAHLLRPARTAAPGPSRTGALKRVPAYKVVPDGHGAHLPADQGAVQADRDREHAGRGDRGRRARACSLPCSRRCGASQETAQHHARGRAARAVPPRQEARGLRRVAVRRAAQAARDGAFADDRSRAGDARRADGRASTRRSSSRCSDT